MSGSYIFFFHLVAFALLAVPIIGGWILNARFVSEENTAQKLYLSGIMKPFRILFALSMLILLGTGIGNIFNLYYGTTQVWYQQGWLVMKVVLFAVMLVNGLFFGPMLINKRLRTIQAMNDQEASETDQGQLKELNKQVRWFFVVQSVLLLGIVFFSAFGTSKHPGYF